jgi:hypothetical protein
MFLASSARSFPWYETAITSAKITKGFQWPAVDLPDMELVAAEDGNLKFAASVCEHSWNDSATFRQHREMNCFVEVAGLASPRAEYAAAAKAGKHDMKNYKKRAGFLEKFMAGLADCSTHAEKNQAPRIIALLKYEFTFAREQFAVLYSVSLDVVRKAQVKCTGYAVSDDLCVAPYIDPLNAIAEMDASAILKIVNSALAGELKKSWSLLVNEKTAFDEMMAAFKIEKYVYVVREL